MRRVPWIYCFSSSTRMRHWFKFYNQLPQPIQRSIDDEHVQDWLYGIFFELWAEREAAEEAMEELRNDNAT